MPDTGETIIGELKDDARQVKDRQEALGADVVSFKEIKDTIRNTIAGDEKRNRQALHLHQRKGLSRRKFLMLLGIGAISSTMIGGLGHFLQRELFAQADHSPTGYAPFADAPGSNVIRTSSFQEAVDSLNSGNKVILEGGTYSWSGDELGGDYANCSLIGDGQVILEHDGGGINFNVTAESGTVLFRNITQQGGTVDSDRTRIAPWAEGDSTLILENFNRPDGVGEDGVDSNGFFIPPEHSGTLRFRNCHVAGFTNNGIYGSAPGHGDHGQVIVEGGLFHMNNVASIRLGSHNSIARHAVVAHNGPPSRLRPPRDGNHRGIWIREDGNNMLIENCDVYAIDTPAVGMPIGLQARDGAGSGTMRGCRIYNEKDVDAIVHTAGDWTGEDICIEGPGSHDHPFDDSAVTEGNCCQSWDLGPYAQQS